MSDNGIAFKTTIFSSLYAILPLESFVSKYHVNILYNLTYEIA